MIFEAAVHPTWISNAYLMALAPGSPALVVDPGAPVEGLLRRATQLDLSITHVVITHRHSDHHEHTAMICEAYPDTKVLCHPLERPHIPVANADALPGALHQIGEMTLRILETPGHTSGSITPLVNGHAFTGDTLFRGSVGGLISPGHTTFRDLRRSIVEVILALPSQTVVHPGHGSHTTVGQELESNPFVRVWRGIDAEDDRSCQAGGESAQLVLWARDYDGGHKAWIRCSDGTDLVLAGSRVELQR